MSEPVKTNPSGSTGGRPSIADEQYWEWFEQMRPFLRMGFSLWAAIEKAGLDGHSTAIYDYVRKNAKFAEKIDRLQSTIAELNNAVVFNTIQGIYNRQALLKESNTPILTAEDVSIIKLVAEKHRTSQTHWVNRTEVAPAKDEDLGKIIERPVIQIIAPAEQINDNEASKQVTKEDSPADNPVRTDPETVPSA